jgi:TonB family protein
MSADQFYDLENRYKNLDFTYGKDNLDKFRFLVAKKLGIESLAPYKKENIDNLEKEKNVAEYEKLDFPPDVLKSLVPKYPEKDRKAGVEGLAVVFILVDETGKVVETEIKKSTGSSSLDSAAIAAASVFEFSPAKKNNKAVKFKMNIPFRFRLE